MLQLWGEILNIGCKALKLGDSVCEKRFLLSDIVLKDEIVLPDGTTYQYKRLRGPVLKRAALERYCKTN